MTRYTITIASEGWTITIEVTAEGFVEAMQKALDQYKHLDK